MNEKKYQICTRCVMDTSIADIVFDDDGVCNYCTALENRKKTDLLCKNDENISILTDKIKKDGKNNEYDCVIGVSGGVDSSYVAHLVTKEYGLRPIAVHLDNGWNSELAVKNIELILKKLDIDLYTHVIDWDEFKDVQLSFLKASVPNCEIPTDHAILALLFNVANKFGIKYILHGGNLSSEGMVPDVWMYDSRDLMHLKSIHKEYGTLPIKSLPVMGYLRLAKYIFVNRIRYISLLNFIEYNKAEAVSLLRSEYGWREYEGKHFESIFTRFFQGYLLPTKFNMDKRRPHLSSLILSGQITRDDAMKELQSEPYSSDLVKQDIKYIKQKLNLSDEEYSKIESEPVRSSTDYKNSKYFIDRFSSIVSLIRKIATAR